MRSSGKSLSWPNKLGQNIFTDWSSWSQKDLHMEYMVLTQTKMSSSTKLEAQLFKKTVDHPKNNVFKFSWSLFLKPLRIERLTDFSCIWTFPKRRMLSQDYSLSSLRNRLSLILDVRSNNLLALSDFCRFVEISQVHVKQYGLSSC